MIDCVCLTVLCRSGYSPPLGIVDAAPSRSGSGSGRGLSVRFLAKQLPERPRASVRLLPTLQPDTAVAHAIAWQMTSPSQGP